MRVVRDYDEQSVHTSWRRVLCRTLATLAAPAATLDARRSPGAHRPYAYDVNHEPIGPDEAGRLLLDAGARQVRATAINDEVVVSTVFLVFDHSFGLGAPVLYESMVFGCDAEVERRYRTRVEAETGHDEVVAMVKAQVEARHNL